jgi:hypothetical protein
MKKTSKDILTSLAATRKLAEALDLIAALEKDYGFRWHPVGGRENNYGTINIGSDPGHAFIERVTNAIDAVIEREALRKQAKGKARAMPASPREAVELWFKVPGGRVAKLANLKNRQELADNVVVALLESPNNRKPTVEIRDRGMGLTAAMVPSTILGLGEGNKIDKTYLAGAYGQGGSTALAFSPKGCLILSRRQPDLLKEGEKDAVAVTFARYNELDPEKNKNGRYEYLVGADGKVASVASDKGLEFEPGTAVVHFDLEIQQYSQLMTQPKGSMWWLLQNALFDPMLPLWAEDRRTSMLEKLNPPRERERRAIAGNYTRLMDDRKEKVEHHGHLTVSLHHGSGDTSVGVNYWVLKPPPDGKGSPIETYVDGYKPVLYTFFGQTHGTDDRRLVTDRMNLPYLAKYLIVQVELDNLSAPARRDLFSSTRDRLKQTSFYDLMRERVAAALSEDEELVRLNEKRKEQVLARHSEAEQNKMQERFARLMEKFKAGIDVSASGKGAADRGRKPVESGGRNALAPLPTKEKPTFIRIANTQRPLLVRIDRHGLLRLESDAPDSYLHDHPHAKLTLACDPEGLIKLDSKSDFRGGRARMTVQASAQGKAGDTGTLTVFLITPDDKSFSSKIQFKIDKPEEESTSGSQGKAKVQVPKPVPVSKDEWSLYDWDERSVAEVMDDGRDIQIPVNIDNRHISKLLHSGGYHETGVKRMKGNYVLYAAFYAWAQHLAFSGKKNLPFEGKDFEEYKKSELDRVAQTVTYAISAASRTEEEE